jgi:hypothetical protein
LRLWDVYFIKGDKFLFRVSLAIFYLLKSEMLKCKDVFALSKVMESVPDLLRDPDKVLKVADKKKFKLKKAEIELLRFMLRGKVIQEIEQGQIKPSNNAEFRRFMRNFCLFNPLMNQHERTNELNSMIDRVVCDQRWPICFLNTAQGRTVDDFFVFRQTNYTIIDDYFSDKI